MSGHLNRGKTRIGIGTWNINGVKKRIGALLRWLNDEKPGLVALQKINVREDEFPYGEFERAGYHAEAHSDSGKHGVAILSRKKPQDVLKGLPGQEEYRARMLTVAVEGLAFSSVYAPVGRSGVGLKLKWFDRLMEHVGAGQSRFRQRVLCGNFNVVPDCRMRSGKGYRSEIVHGEEVREKFRTFQDAGGLSDLYTRQESDWKDPFRYEGREGFLRFS